jgi:hypothetical protein
MARRVLPVGLVVAAAAADGAGVHGIAFYLLLAAVPVAAATALSTFGDLLDGHGDHLEVFLSGTVLALTVAGAAVRAPVLADGSVPPLAHSVLLVSLAVLCFQALLTLTAELGRRNRPHVRS